jgi:ubiquinone/menaquinone biosynthesis C-methylase UbiE
MSSLLPTTRSEFHSKKYWDDFFKKRNEAFEWYGNYNEFSLFLLEEILKEDKLLVIGCGNSNISSKLYENGYENIINLDFSSTVINEMKIKNSSKSRMTWIVGDMTNMTDIPSHSIDIVFDKGALDALLSDDSEQILDKAHQMFLEIERVLVPNGKYICISLAQDFVIKTCINHFTQMNNNIKCSTRCDWNISIQRIQQSEPSSFTPFFITTKKSLAPSSTVKVKFNSIGEPLVSFNVLPPEEALKLV